MLSHFYKYKDLAIYLRKTNNNMIDDIQCGTDDATALF